MNFGLVLSSSIITEGLPELEYLALGNSVANLINSISFPKWDATMTFSISNLATVIIEAGQV